MKKAKRFPFLRIQQRRFSLYFSNESGLGSAKGIPSERQFRLWAWHALKNRFRAAEISILLLDEETARAYNRDYRGKDYATNVLSFALDEGEMLPENAAGSGSLAALHGDLVICPQVVIREAAEQGKNIEAHFAHLTLHGTLHLMGYDHIEEAEAEAMEALETRLLNQLAYPDPYLQDEI